MKKLRCAADGCQNRFEQVAIWHIYCSERCSTRMRVKRLRARRNGHPTGPDGGSKQLSLLDEKLSASDKGGTTGILLTRRRPPQRTQIDLPLSAAALILFVIFLGLLSSLPVYALAPAQGVQGASPKDSPMHQPATLRKVVHRKPVPFMPYASEPKYLLCFVTETLECGHSLEVFPQADPLIAQRRRCKACDAKVVSIAVGVKSRKAASSGVIEKIAA